MNDLSAETFQQPSGTAEGEIPDERSRLEPMPPEGSGPWTRAGEATPARRNTEAAARILVIDDEQPILNGTRRLLRSHEVSLALGVQAGLDALEADHSWEVILCDLMMPTVTGMDVFEQVVSGTQGWEASSSS